MRLDEHDDSMGRIMMRSMMTLMMQRMVIYDVRLVMVVMIMVTVI